MYKDHRKMLEISAFLYFLYYFNIFSSKKNQFLIKLILTELNFDLAFRSSFP